MELVCSVYVQSSSQSKTKPISVHKIFTSASKCHWIVLKCNDSPSQNHFHIPLSSDSIQHTNTFMYVINNVMLTSAATNYYFHYQLNCFFFVQPTVQKQNEKENQPILTFKMLEPANDTFEQLTTNIYFDRCKSNVEEKCGTQQ